MYGNHASLNYIFGNTGSTPSKKSVSVGIVIIVIKIIIMVIIEFHL